MIMTIAVRPDHVIDSILTVLLFLCDLDFILFPGNIPLGPQIASVVNCLQNTDYCLK